MSERIFQLVDDIDVIGKTESDEQVARDKLAHSQRLWPHRNPRLIRTDTGEDITNE